MSSVFLFFTLPHSSFYALLFLSLCSQNIEEHVVTDDVLTLDEMPVAVVEADEMREEVPAAVTEQVPVDVPSSSLVADRPDPPATSESPPPMKPMQGVYRHAAPPTSGELYEAGPRKRPKRSFDGESPEQREFRLARMRAYNHRYTHFIKKGEFFSHLADVRVS